jgi:flagellum-specific peptidoglycan hydrolase FlgJ
MAKALTLAEASGEIARAAVAAERETGFPAEVIAAQAALESGWLTSAPGNNAFGWKAIAGHERQLLKTREWLDQTGVAEYVSADDGRAIVRATGRAKGNRHEYEVMDFFAKFDSLARAFSVHVARLMTVTRYRAVWDAYRKRRFSSEREGIEFLIAGIAGAGYATDPEYAAKLTRIATGERLTVAIAIARSQNSIRGVA